ncbi:unnamed protein product [Cylindrotheca closterium]|uniref:Reverse transcriptase Ty1/copia-type domain-containing protein n=1 Tax=Cylindrotheca closterium TaxID=2856 RepID=A0AAD2FPB6_9STRA|nr:unnamed protein product [Cylindrotheca closterium]
MLVANSTATVDATPEGPRLPQNGPVPVTQEEPTNSFMTEQGESASISPDGDEDSVHSADEALDDHQVSPESLDVHLRNIAGLTEDEDLFDSICGHEFRDGVLFLQILWKTDETSWEKYCACREDFPYDVAKYICSKKIGSASGNHSNGPHQRWARTFLKKTRRVMRRFVRYHGYSKPMLNTHNFCCPREDDSDQIQLTKMHKKSPPRQVRRAKKKGRLRRPLPIRYGIPILRTVKEALALDDDNGNHFWREAMEKEIASLIAMNCFDFHTSDYKPGPNSQFAPLRMIFEAKQDGRRKGRLGLTIVHGDVGNAFITANCLEEIRRARGAVITINKALYGLRTSSRAYRETFAAFMRTIGFQSSRYDRDVWMRLREDNEGYDYLCTHVDDFKVVAKDPQRWSYYYLASHPEEDKSDFLDDAGKRQYQMLVGMAQWAVTIGRMDIAYAVSLLNRFSSAPCEGHLELAFYLFGYLKKFPNKQLPVDSRPLELCPTLTATKGTFKADFLEEYPDAKEDRDPKEPKAFGKPVQTSVFFDANLAHDLVTRRSITGLLVYVGSTLVSWTSKRQGCIASSTYCSEFIAMRAATEEAISIRYMLCSLGVPVEEPTNLLGDNLGVIQSAAMKDADLKKKHVAISYHCVREAVAAQIIKPIWCKTDENWSDICTEALGGLKQNAILSRTML